VVIEKVASSCGKLPPVIGPRLKPLTVIRRPLTSTPALVVLTKASSPPMKSEMREKSPVNFSV
jgi:hypothetical protein